MRRKRSKMRVKKEYQNDEEKNRMMMTKLIPII